jgi:NitT/TauT family transport system substrate-binding protein
MLPRTVSAAVLIMTLVAAAGCTGGSTGGAGQGAGGSLEKITYLTSFGTFGRDAYAYVAKDKGYFAAAGFDVEIKPGAGTLDNLKSIIGGRSQFTALDLTGLLLAAGGREPVTGFTAVAGIHQRTMAAIISLEGNGITTPKDLEGKKIADTPGSVVRNLFPTYALLTDVDEKSVTWQDGTPQTLIGTLAAGRAAGIGQFVVGKPTVESVAKKPAVVLAFSDHLQDLYGNVLVTQQSYAKTHPERVEKFTAALLKGLRDAIANPAAAGVALKKYVPGANSQQAAAELRLMEPFVKSEASGVPVGALDDQRVARSIAILQGTGQIQPGLTPEAVIDFDLVPHR